MTSAGVKCVPKLLWNMFHSGRTYSILAQVWCLCFCVRLCVCLCVCMCVSTNVCACMNFTKTTDEKSFKALQKYMCFPPLLVLLTFAQTRNTLYAAKREQQYGCVRQSKCRLHEMSISVSC